jgi:hypothetical protein
MISEGMGVRVTARELERKIENLESELQKTINERDAARLQLKEAGVPIGNSLVRNNTMIKNNSLFLKRLSEKYSSLVTQTCINDLFEIRDFLDTLSPSKKTHYNKLDEVFNPIYKLIGQKLDKLGFINCNVEKNKEKPDVGLMWALYGELDCFSHSQFYRELNETCAVHHASAFGRVHALKCEMDLFFQSNNLSKK